MIWKLQGIGSVTENSVVHVNLPTPAQPSGPRVEVIRHEQQPAGERVVSLPRTEANLPEEVELNPTC